MIGSHAFARVGRRQSGLRESQTAAYMYDIPVCCSKKRAHKISEVAGGMHSNERSQLKWFGGSG